MNDMGKETKNLGGEMEETDKKTSVFGDVLKASLAADAIKAGLSPWSIWSRLWVRR